MLSLEEVTNIAYSDESNYNDGRYRSIAMVSLSAAIVKRCHTDLENLLAASNVAEFKWNELNSAQMRFAGVKLLDYAIKLLRCGGMRIDVLIWDTLDSRHDVQGRDDCANLERMYFHLFKHVLTSKWHDNACWALCPDQNSVIDWATVQYYLDTHNASLVSRSDLLETVTYLKEHYKIKLIRECRSVERPLVQLADLFAGMGQHSWNDFNSYHLWQQHNSKQLMFNGMFKDGRLSDKKEEQWRLIDYIKNICDSKKWGVSLNSSKGLQTRGHNNLLRPVNFWLYDPQHQKDKAPVRPTKRARLISS